MPKLLSERKALTGILPFNLPMLARFDFRLHKRAHALLQNEKAEACSKGRFLFLTRLCGNLDPVRTCDEPHQRTFNESLFRTVLTKPMSIETKTRGAWVAAQQSEEPCC